jgi:hypothetical protein
MDQPHGAAQRAAQQRITFGAAQRRQGRTQAAKQDDGVGWQAMALWWVRLKPGSHRGDRGALRAVIAQGCRLSMQPKSLDA